VNTAPEVAFRTLHFLCYLWTVPVSWSVTLHLSGKASPVRIHNLLGPFVNYKETYVLWVQHKGCIDNTSFSLLLINGPNKLECYITLVWKCFFGRNTLANWAQSQFKCECGPCSRIHNTFFLLIGCKAHVDKINPCLWVKSPRRMMKSTKWMHF
jgi:hypothetical protein